MVSFIRRRWVTLPGLSNEAFKREIHNLYFNDFSDKFSVPIGSLVGEIYVRELRKKGVNENDVLNSIKSNLTSRNKRILVTSLFGLMIFCFEKRISPLFKGEKIISQHDFDDIARMLIPNIKSDDKHVYLPTIWSIAWFNESFTISKKLQLEILKNLLDVWEKYKSFRNLDRMCTWAINTILTPEMKIDEKILNFEQMKPILNRRLNNPNNEYDKVVSIYLSIHLKISLDMEEVEKILVEEKKKNRYSGNHVEKYSKKIGLKLDKKE